VGQIFRIFLPWHDYQLSGIAKTVRDLINRLERGGPY
jgi:hypothetical protein